MSGQSRRRTQREQESWRCELCSRTVAEIGPHPLPIQQRAHLLPNRLTGSQWRYAGAKNTFSDAEWSTLLEAIGPSLRADLDCAVDLRERAATHCYDLCGECHEEVLSEPVYLPSVLRLLQSHFKGASRVQKVLILSKVLELGAMALEQVDRGGQKTKVEERMSRSTTTRTDSSIAHG